ncbi:MAG TPA: hypothetical protein VFU43_26240 [Streptosporangiaceae bacterium]|nr:hypothetical protein [Streptosporangiaceae bacterium]
MTLREALERKAPAPISSSLRASGRRPVLIVSALFAGGALLFWLPLRGVRMGAMNGYGLISVLPIATLAGAAVLTVAFVASLGLRRPYRVLLIAQLLVTIASLHGLAQFLEPYARFPTAWQHAGFIEFIARTHTVDVGLDARFSWPAFFALIAFITKAIGQTDIEPVLHWTPLVIEALYLVPLYLIFRTMNASWRAKWLAAWLFVVADWVGQDYLSPQAFAYLLYLFWVAILLNWFRPADGGARREGRRRTAETRRTERTGPFWRAYAWVFGPMEPGELPPRQTGQRERTILLVLLVLIFAVVTAAHQLTPFLLLIAAAGFVVLRRCTLRGLPFIGGVIFAAWVSFMTVGYWAGHADDIFGGVGQLGSNLGSSVAGRISQSSEQLAQVQQVRILLALLLAALAGLGFLRRRARRIDDRVAIVLFIGPFFSFGLQSYGGEIALRVFFFILPGAALLAAYLFFPETADRSEHAQRPADPEEAGRLAGWARRFRPSWAPRPWPTIAAATACGLAIVGGFLFVRFGNEKFEQIRPGDVRAYDVMLNQGTGAVNVVWLTGDAPNAPGASATPVMPWGYRAMERFSYAPVTAAADPADISRIIAALRAQGPGGFFVTTRGHEAFLELNYGIAADYGTRVRTALARAPQLRVIYTSPDAAVYALRRPPPEPVPTVPRPQGLVFGSTPWTPAGLVYLPVLLGVLLARELRRLRLEPDDYRRLRPLTVLSVPLFVGFLAVVVERFVNMA